MSIGIIGNGSPVPLELSGAVPVALQDQTSRMVDLCFIKALSAPVFVAVEGVADQYTLTLSDATGFVNGTYFGVFCPTGQFFFATQLGAAAGNTITFDMPVPHAIPAGCNVIRVTKNMNVNGAVTRQVFQIGPVGLATGISVDITGVHGSITDGTAMDDGLFGGIAALTRGVAFRKSNGVNINYANFKTNGCIAQYAGQANNYTDKAPAGQNGLTFSFQFAGQNERGVAIRLAPGEILEMIVQDDLTGLTSFVMSAHGHYVTG